MSAPTAGAGLPVAWSSQLKSIVNVSIKVEQLADKISANKAQILECDMRRQAAIEALAQFRASKREPPSTARIGEKVWTCGGPVFFKLSADQAEAMCVAEKDARTNEIAEIRKEMKKDLSELLALSPDQHMDPASLKLLLQDTPS